jgi:DNA-binding response OmpR family regulator
VVAADQALARDLAVAIDSWGYAVGTVNTVDQARRVLLPSPADIVVLDATLADSLVLLGDLKKAHPDQIVMLVASARRAQEVVLGFRLGADDVVSRPIDQTEFRARMEAILRRLAHTRGRPVAPIAHGIADFDDLRLDDARGVAELAGVPLKLTRTEYEILSALVGQPDHVLSRREIVQTVWGGASGPESRALDAYIGRLRRKMRAARTSAPNILSVRLQAYRLVRAGSELDVP